jgi:hypothetical protein
MRSASVRKNSQDLAAVGMADFAVREMIITKGLKRDYFATEK